MKKCKICKKPFTSRGIGHVVCSWPCAIEHAKQKKKKEFNSETRKLKQKIKTRAVWLKEAQAAFNAYVRERDKGRPCISCGRFHGGQHHAGHYLTTAAHPELRFNALNCHRQCAPCNNHLSGNIVEYRKALIEKIGIESVDWLEGPHELQKLTIEEISDIKKLFNDLTRHLKKEQHPFDALCEGLE